LASDSEDEKDLGRAEKEARKDAERQVAKHRCGKQSQSAMGKRPRWGQWPDKGASAEAPPVNPGMRPAKQPPLGPCWRCCGYGHLAASCKVSRLYPLSVK